MKLYDKTQTVELRALGVCLGEFLAEQLRLLSGAQEKLNGMIREKRPPFTNKPACRSFHEEPGKS